VEFYEWFFCRCSKLKNPKEIFGVSQHAGHQLHWDILRLLVASVLHRLVSHLTNQERAPAMIAALDYKQTNHHYSYEVKEELIINTNS
jgi:hypothetical protein